MAGDRQVGFVLRDGRRLLTCEGAVGASTWAFERSGGCLSLTDDAGDGGSGANMEMLLRVACHMRRIRDDVDQARARIRKRLHRSEPNRPAEEVAAAVAAIVTEVGAALDVMEPSLSSLDPEAVETALAFSDQVTFRVGEYAALDATLDPEVPLRRALRAFPFLAQTSARLLRADPAAFRHAATDPDARALRQALAGHVARECGSRRAGDIATRVAEVVRTMSVKHADVFTFEVESNASGDEAAVVAGHLLARLPPSWMPEGIAAWDAFAACAPAVARATCAAAPGDVAAMVNARADWVGLERRLRVASDAPTDGRGRTFRLLENALNDLEDVIDAMHAQVVVPACVTSGAEPPRRAHGLPLEQVCHGGRDEGPRDVSYDLLFSGRSVRRMLEASERWHGLASAMRDALPRGIDAPASWPPVLPDAEVDGVAVTVLRTVDALVREGADGLDPDGLAGLGHCVGGYARRCLTERCRVVSLRGRDADGHPVRLSTAEVTWDDGGTPSIVQHRGRGNAEPPPEADGALRVYLDLAREGMAGFVDTAEATGLGQDAALVGAGYDWREPGAWETVRDLWAPFLPRAARPWSAREFAAFAVRSASREWTWMASGPCLEV